MEALLDLLIDFIFEFLLTGAVEAAGAKKIPLAIRLVVLSVVLLVYGILLYVAIKLLLEEQNIFALVVALACVTTAVALVSSAANHFADLCKGRVSYQIFVILICVFSAVVSNLGLDTIVSIAAPILGIVYPPVLVLVIVSLVAPKMTNSICIAAVIGAAITSILSALDGFGLSMPWLRYLPLSSVDMAWVLPAAIFGVAAFLYRLPWQEKVEDD